MAKAANGNSGSSGKGSPKNRLRSATEAFEEAIKRNALRPAKYLFLLYVSGSSSRSLRAVHNLRKLCDEHLPNEYELEVIDLYEDPGAAREEQILAAPTLVKKLPRPIRRFVGDLSNTQKILVGLEIYNRPEAKGN